LGRSVPVIEQDFVRYGLASRCAKVRAPEVTVLSLEEANSPARTRASAEISLAITVDRAEAIVLGCAGMADLAKSLSAEHCVPVIDGVAAAIGLAEMLARTSLQTSKLGGYTRPLHKSYAGMFADFAPPAV
jgi:allantoin racemase